MPDLWVKRPHSSGFGLLERPAWGAGTSWHAWATLADDEEALVPPPDGQKAPTMRAAIDDKEEEEIVVKGTRTKDMGDDSDWAVFWSGGTCETGDIGGGGSNTGSSPPEKVADHPQDCGTDDGAAVQVAKHVMGVPPGAGPSDPLITPGGSNWTQVEFGAVIVRNADGSYGALNDAIYSNDSPSQAHLPSFEGSDAVGIWHNHSTRGDPDQQMTDRYPSSYPDSRGDWDALQRLHDAVAPNNPNFNPSLWITGPDGITREFKLSDRASYESLTPDQMKAGEGLDGTERTQSCG